MKTIWKFQLPPHPGHGVWIEIVEMPVGARPLSAHLQPVGGWSPEPPSWRSTRITIWAEVDVDQKDLELRHFAVIGTGWQYPGARTFLGTIFDGPFIWHVFDLGLASVPPHATDEAERAASAATPEPES